MSTEEISEAPEVPAKRKRGRPRKSEIHRNEGNRDTLLSRRMRMALAEAGLHPKEACVRAGLHPEALRNVLLGLTHSPRPRTMEAMSQLLRRPVRWFMDPALPDDLPPMPSEPPPPVARDADTVSIPYVEPDMPGGHTESGPAFVVPRDFRVLMPKSAGETVMLRAPNGHGAIRRGDFLMADTAGTGLPGLLEVFRLPTGHWVLRTATEGDVGGNAERWTVLGHWRASDL